MSDPAANAERWLRAYEASVTATVEIRADVVELRREARELLARLEAIDRTLERIASDQADETTAIREANNLAREQRGVLARLGHDCLGLARVAIVTPWFGALMGAVGLTVPTLVGAALWALGYVGTPAAPVSPPEPAPAVGAAHVTP